MRNLTQIAVRPWRVKQSLHSLSFSNRRIFLFYSYGLLKLAFSGPKTFRGFLETGPWSSLRDRRCLCRGSWRWPWSLWLSRKQMKDLPVRGRTNPTRILIWIHPSELLSGAWPASFGRVFPKANFRLAETGRSLLTIKQFNCELEILSRMI